MTTFIEPVSMSDERFNQALAASCGIVPITCWKEVDDERFLSQVIPKRKTSPKKRVFIIIFFQIIFLFLFVLEISQTEAGPT